MPMRSLAAAMERVAGVLRRRPDMALQADAPAHAHWQGGARIVTAHAGGMQVTSDLPAELGGAGDAATPGWLFRAALASCAATSIAMRAAAEGIELGALEVRADSRSDTRGLLGMAGADGEPVYSGPHGLALRVRIAAPGIAPARLRALVESGVRHSPIPSLVQQATPLRLDIDADEAA
jgi:uncharacterized OsmC-like protein